MELGLFGFIILIIAYFLFKPAVNNAVNMVNEGVASASLALHEPEKVAAMKRKFGCNDPNIQTMSDLLAWVNSHRNAS